MFEQYRQVFHCENNKKSKFQMKIISNKNLTYLFEIKN